MPRKFKVLAVAFATVSLLVANVGLASAHNWGNYHWNRGGSQVVLNHYIYGTHQTEAEYARQDGWNKIGILYDYRVYSHSDISVWGGNFGATGWWGLASLEDLDWDWGSWGWNHIAHGHARYNSYYGGTTGYGGDVQGVFCQEIAHTWGFDHSNTGDCMGKSYYNNINFFGPHNNTDFYNRYRYH